MREGGERGQARLENLAELVTAAQTFDPSFEYLLDDDGLEPEESRQSDLEEFLSHASLEAGEQQAGDSEDCVQMMTMHSAKGLEFPLVFLAGMEDGLFPHTMSMEEPGRLEEERRLCYVGITRAMRNLFDLRGIQKNPRQRDDEQTIKIYSEIPEEVVKEVRMNNTGTPTHRNGR